MKQKLIKVNIGDGCPEGFKDFPVPPDWKVFWKTFKKESVEEFRCAYYFQQIPGKERGPWMDELWRVLVPGAKALFITQYWTSFRAFMDYRSEWPPVVEQSYLYFNKAWRESQKVEWCHCDFDIVGQGHMHDPETASKAQEVKDHWTKHYVNAALDLHMYVQKKT